MCLLPISIYSLENILKSPAHFLLDFFFNTKLYELFVYFEY